MSLRLDEIAGRTRTKKMRFGSCLTVASDVLPEVGVDIRYFSGHGVFWKY